MGRQRRTWLLALAGTIGCASVAGPSEVAPRKAPEAKAAGTDPAPAGRGISEAHARAILASRFRAAGVRIVYDVAVDVGGTIIVADGYDPDTGIGYEYVAHHDPHGGLVAPPSSPVLVVGPASADDVARAADEFLDRYSQ